ncbi:CCC motif membrane protein [Urechidicola croceus]|uniref:DUF4190 domain-containing protein n=1 Tax=Urechidicola croceus TaxID=1850246 RepID=A0A1D8P4Y2_9FLAO|nr:CCC motif membrane protein [Urechidicola croceus]AOW19571.1 hypothetical protein LPB138_02260 [Urechidicola croceus]
MEKQKLQGANSALILGIFSIITACCCSGLPGLILGIIGLNSAKKAKAAADANPDAYSNIGNIEAGRITSLIGVVLGVIFLLWTIYLVSSGQWQEQMEQYQEMIEQMQNQ